MSPQEVVIVSAPPMPSVGGIQSFTDGLIKEFLDLGMNVTLVTTTNGSQKFKEPYRDVATYRLRSLQFISGRFPVPIHIFEVAFVAWSVFFDRMGAITIIQARFYPTSLLFVLLARLAGHRIAVVDHGSGPLTLNNRFADFLSSTYERVVTLAIRTLRPHFYGVSPRSLDWLKTFGIRKARLFANGVAEGLITAERQRSDRTFTVIYCGRLIAQKGVFELLIACGQLRTEGLCRLRIIGDGPLAKPVRDACEQALDCAFVGPLSHADAMLEVAAADLVVVPSKHPEGSPTLILEAGALGIPVAVTREADGAGIIQHGVNGIVFNSSSAADIAAGSRQIRDASDRGAAMGKSLQALIAERYTWRAVVANFLSGERVQAGFRRSGSERPASDSNGAPDVGQVGGVDDRMVWSSRLPARCRAGSRKGLS